MSDIKLHEKLNEIQTSLIANKDAFNSFGKYKYRSCKSILEALKPHLKTSGAVLTLSDEVVAVGERIYVQATACLSDGNSSISSTAYAREASQKKGMDDSQITGTASSYARKYALCGLFAIDDNKDADALSQGEQIQSKPNQAEQKDIQRKPVYSQADFDNNKKSWKEAMRGGRTTAENIINKISTQYTLTPKQTQELRGMK